MIIEYKRGQFYLVTAIIFISLFVAFASTYNFLRKDEGIGIYDLKKELEIESEKTMEYIAYNKLDDDSSREIFSNFTDIYIEKIGENKNSFFIYGTPSNLTLRGFKATDENVLVGVNSENLTELNEEKGEEFGPIFYSPNIENFTIVVEEIEKTFEIREGQSFYYLIHYKETGGEYIVAHN